MDQRLKQIARCMDELSSIRSLAPAGYWGALLGEMDWLEELHRLIWEGTA